MYGRQSRERERGGAGKRSRLAEEAVLCRVLLRDDAGMTGDFDGI